MNPDNRLTAVRRVDGALECTLWNDYTKQSHTPDADQVVMEHGTKSIADVFDLIAGSSNQGEVDLDSQLPGHPETRGKGYQLSRIGDAVASRDIHAAIYETRRLCKDL